MRSTRFAAPRAARVTAALAGLVALGVSGCTLVHELAHGAPQSRPSGDEGMLVYTVGRLSFVAPEGWQARGDPRHVLLVSPTDDARIDAQVMERTFPDDARCLADAEQALVRGSAKLTKVRRHPSTLAGRKALAQEADQGRWHGWAWAVCDGGEQYRLFFTGLSPLKEENVRAVRLLASRAVLLTRTAGLTGEPR